MGRIHAQAAIYQISTNLWLFNVRRIFSNQYMKYSGTKAFQLGETNEIIVIETMQLLFVERKFQPFGM